MMNQAKPFDALNRSKGAEIVLTLKNDEVYTGKLESFDIHLNIVLNDATLTHQEKVEKLGTVLIRGDALQSIRNLK